jgi:rhodanese-related sulfurtransferase
MKLRDLKNYPRLSSAYLLMSGHMSSVLFLWPHDQNFQGYVSVIFCLRMFEPTFCLRAGLLLFASLRSVMAIDGTGVPNFKLAGCNCSWSSLVGLYASSEPDPPGPDARPFPTIDPLELREHQRDIHSYGYDVLLIIDARSESEYAGGHIIGAINVRASGEMKRLFDAFSGSSVCLIFYCEFSTNRGPELMRNFREYDRFRNILHHPWLTYPTMYLLKGGYKEFYDGYPASCQGGYVPGPSQNPVGVEGLRGNHSLHHAQAPNQPVFSMRQMRSMPDESHDPDETRASMDFGNSKGQ